MVSQNNEVNCLIHLLSCAINQKECEDIGDVDFKELFSLAKKHQVYNIIYPVICDFDSIPQYEKDKWRNYNLTEIKRMITINNFLNDRIKCFYSDTKTIYSIIFQEIQ